MSTISLNLGSVSYEAHRRIAALDRCHIGTSAYMGVAAFWDSEFKCMLRKMTPAKRRQVHSFLIDNGAVVESCTYGYKIDSGHPANRAVYVAALQKFGG